MFSKLIILLFLYMMFLAIRGAWRTYKILGKGNHIKMKTEQNTKIYKDDQNTFEADYKIIN